MKLRIFSYLTFAALVVLLAGCACSKKSPDNADQTAGVEQADNSAQKLDGKGMDWKYKNEVIIGKDDPDGTDKIYDLYDKAGDNRAQIHYQFQIKSEEDLQKLSDLLLNYGRMVSTFEVMIPAGVIPDADIRLPMMIDEEADTRLIVTGIGDKPVELPGVQLELEAGTIVIRNFVFNQQKYRNAIKASVTDNFIAENLSFSDNRYEDRHQYMAEPLIVLKYHGPEENFSNYKLKNVSFINNESTGLLMIDQDSLGKFKHIELDHVVVKGNSNQNLGIDVSGTEDALIKNCELSGSKISPTLVQILPQTQVKFVDSSVADKAFGYRPRPDDWKTDPKPVVKKNLKEAEGTVFDRVP